MRQLCFILLLCSTAIAGNFTSAVLVHKLGDPKYEVRERATISLSGLMPQSEPYLKSACNHPNKEISTRAGMVLDKYYREQAPVWAEKIFPDKYSRLPWIDKLPMTVPDREEIIREYINKANKAYQIAGTNQSGWPVYRLATKMYVKNLIVRGKTREEIVEMLNTMAEAEIEWIKKYGKTYDPPIELPQ